MKLRCAYTRSLSSHPQTRASRVRNLPSLSPVKADPAVAAVDDAGVAVDAVAAAGADTDHLDCHIPRGSLYSCADRCTLHKRASCSKG